MPKTHKGLMSPPSATTRMTRFEGLRSRYNHLGWISMTQRGVCLGCSLHFPCINGPIAGCKVALWGGLHPLRTAQLLRRMVAVRLTDERTPDGQTGTQQNNDKITKICDITTTIIMNVSSLTHASQPQI